MKHTWPTIVLSLGLVAGGICVSIFAGDAVTASTLIGAGVMVTTLRGRQAPEEGK